MMADWRANKAWADRFLPEIQKVIRDMAFALIDLNPAPEKEDMQQGTDYLFTVGMGTLACRIRTAKTKYRVYAWVAPDSDEFVDWVFIDLDTVRLSGLLDRTFRQISNPDGSTFVAVSARDLYNHDCLIGFCYQDTTSVVHYRLLDDEGHQEKRMSWFPEEWK